MYKLLILLLLSAAACSPYKKTILTMGEQMTNRFKGATEKEVLDAMGTGHTRAEQANGYLLRFDYSYNITGKLQQPNAAPTRTTDRNGQPILVQKNSVAPPTQYSNTRYNASRVNKFLEFYFDIGKRVQYVYAEGYPDSVVLVKR
jgi:hypothetical protein